MRRSTTITTSQLSLRNGIRNVSHAISLPCIVVAWICFTFSDDSNIEVFLYDLCADKVVKRLPIEGKHVVDVETAKEYTSRIIWDNM